jgi:hypothetical protein
MKRLRRQFVLGALGMVTGAVVMPGHRGRELAHEPVAVLSALKVLRMSGHAPDAIAHPGEVDLGIRFLSKPVRYGAFLPIREEPVG